MTDQPVQRLILTGRPAPEIRDLISRRWSALHEGEPFPDAWAIQDSDAGAVVVSRHGDYPFDVGVAADASMPRGRAWIVDLPPEPKADSWKGGKLARTSMEETLGEMERRGLSTVADALRRGGGYVAARVEGLSPSDEAALRAEIAARPGWEASPAGDGLTARGPSWAETQRWAREVEGRWPEARVFLLWRPWLRPPSVLAYDSSGKTRVWYPPEVTAVPVGAERVDRMFGADSWDTILAAAHIPPAWFPEEPELLR